MRRPDGQLGKPAHGVGRTGKGEVGVIRDVDGVDACKRGSRRGLVFPVESGLARAGRGAHRAAGRLEPCGDSTSRFASGADDQGGSRARVCHACSAGSTPEATIAQILNFIRIRPQ